MQYDLTGNTVSSTYGRLVQTVDGLYYDGFGNLLNIGGGTSSVGPQGPTGNIGPQGPTGPMGLSGSFSFTFSITGNQGATGPQGPGFNSIYNPGINYVLVSDGSSNSAVGQSGLIFNGSNSTLTIGTGSNSFTIGGSASINNVSYITFNTNPSFSPTSSLLFYDKEEESLAYYSNDILTSPIHIGRELFERAWNLTGYTISKGSIITINGSTGGISTITTAIASGTNSQVVGVVNNDIPNDSIGEIIISGIVTGLDLNILIEGTYSYGSTLYLSDKTAGKYTTNYYGLSYSSRANIVGRVISDSKIAVAINNENTNLLITDRQRGILEGNVNSTGVFYFPAPGITISTPTSVNISPVKGWVVDNAGPTTSTIPTVKLVEYPGATGVSITGISSSTITYFYIDSNAVLHQQSSFPTPQQRRENIYIGKVGHPNKTTVNLFFAEPDIDVSPMSQVRDMFTPIKLINDGVYPSPNGSTLSFNTSAGTLWGLGIGFTKDTINPSSIVVPGYSPATFQYRLRDSGTYSNTTLIDPNNYDLNGVLTAIGGGANTSSNQRIFLLQDGSIRVQYAQETHSTLAAAIAAASTEQFITFPNWRYNGILIGILSVKNGATNLSNTAQARFLLISKFGETVGAASGLSTTTLQQAYNNSSEPEIITNSTLDGITFRRGSAADTDAVLQIQNGSASNTFYVTGEGNTYLSSLHITGLTGSTLSLFIDPSGRVGATTSTGNGAPGPTGPAGATGAGGALGYYGSFYDTTIQTNPTASFANPIYINNTAESNGISIINGSEMKFDFGGVYNIQFSVVYQQSNSSATDVDIWLTKNGINIPNTNTELTLAGSNTSVASWNFMLTMNANEYIQLYWSSSDTSVFILASGTQSNPLRPEIPSVILTAQQVMYTQLGPTGSQGLQGPAATYYVQSQPPAPTGSNSGDRWYDLSTGYEYVWIDDGDSSQWVTPVAQGLAPSTASFFVNEGNSFGKTATLGTIDNNNLELLLNNTIIGSFVTQSSDSINGPGFFRFNLMGNTVSSPVTKNDTNVWIQGVTTITSNTSLITLFNSGLNSSSQRPYIKFLNSNGNTSWIGMRDDSEILGIGSLSSTIASFATSSVIFNTSGTDYPFSVQNKSNNIFRINYSGAISAGTVSNATQSEWKLGKVINGASSLDDTKYIEVSIDDVIYKIALIV
jgi:hypothetical protein